MKPPAIALPATPNLGAVRIEFKGVSVTVTDRASGQRKSILTDAHGFAQPGRLLSIMGPSGAGKSTLLDVLACNSQSSSQGVSVEGALLVNGMPRSTREFTKISCYVQQKDVLLSSATVRESLLTSALLKLPRSVPMEAKRRLVEDVLEELGLVSCAETLIGDETIGLKGVSGGQKRRVSVGIELVKDPRVIFLDEPTSGLDSEMALTLMETLVALARRQRTVVCTIHQPNSDITDMFDDFILLASGRIVYGGVWEGAVPFFMRHGYSCPNYKNPTDFFMSVIKDAEAVDTLASAYTKSRGELLEQMASAAASPAASAYGTLGSGRKQQAARSMARLAAAAEAGLPGAEGGSCYGGAGDGSAASPATTAATAASPLPAEQQQRGGAQGHVALEVAVLGSQAAGGQRPSEGGASTLSGPAAYSEASVAEAGTAAVPLWYQTCVLAQRYRRTLVRNPVMMWSELVQYLFLAIFVGLMYHRFNHKLGQGDYDRIACIWFSFAVLSFTPSYTAVTAWDKERLLLKRELGQKLYSVSAYYVARYAVLVPFEVAQCLLFVSILYFFVGFHASPENFFVFFAILSMFQIISEGIGVCCAVVTRQATYGIILLTFVILLLLSFSGFLISKIPVYFVWVQKTSYLTYAFSALTENEFSKVSFVDPATGDVVPGMDVFPPTLVTGLTFSQNVGVLAAQVLGMEALKLFAFNLAHYANLM